MKFLIWPGAVALACLLCDPMIYAAQPVLSPDATLSAMGTGTDVIAAQPISAAELRSRMARGREVYNRTCFACHQFNGAGVPGAFPPLIKSDALASDLEYCIRAVCEGLSDEIVVKGRKYAGVMPPQVIDDTEVAATRAAP